MPTGHVLEALAPLENTGYRRLFTRRALLRFAIVWILLIVIGSFLPSKTKRALGTVTRSRVPAVRAMAVREHRVVHFVQFGIAALLLSVLGANLSQRSSALLGIIMLGLLIEYAQHLLGRGPLEWWDVRDDTYSACVGCLLGAWQVIRCWLVRE